MVYRLTLKLNIYLIYCCKSYFKKNKIWSWCSKRWSVTKLLYQTRKRVCYKQLQ